MAVTTRKYNPGFLSDDEIVASFCVRTDELTSLVEMLRECTGNSNPHQLVIGPRGSGKTSLLRRVAAEVPRDDVLSASFFPIVFAEESYEVTTEGEFWLECLSRLAVQAPHWEGSPDLHRTYDELRTIRDDRMLENRCLGALLDFSDREGKRLVLLVENLNMMFGDMADQDAGWRLRKILQTEPRIILIASATSRFDQIDNPDQALYDLFRVLQLRPLDPQECAVLWKTVAGHDARPETIRSLQILTGGDPRLVVIVARFGAGRSFRNLMANLLDLVDDHTEYFKSHLELLPAQERRVYLALADLWKPATTKEIADRARLGTSPCSAQLTRLVGRGVVEEAGGTARRKQYYLTQRLYNIYYLLRRPRGPDRLVEALIRFMEAFYAPHELRDIGVEMAREAGNFDGDMRTLHQTALVRLLALPALAEHRDTLLTVIPPDLSEVLAQDRISPDGMQLELSGARVAPHQADHLYGNVDASEEMVARELMEKGEAFRRLHRSEDALATYDEVVRRFGTSKVPALREMVAGALLNKGVTLGDLHRSEDALATYDEIMRRFGASKTPTLQEVVAKTLVNKGTILGDLHRSEDALATYDEVVQRFGTSKVPALREMVAGALFNKGITQGKLHRLEDALATYDEVVRRFGTSKVPALREVVAKILVNKGTILGDLHRSEDALATYDEVVQRFGAIETPALREATTGALVNKGTLLGKLHRSEDALATYDEIMRRFGAIETPALREVANEVLAAKILVNKGATLSELRRLEDALATYDEVVQRFGAIETPALREVVATALVNKGSTLSGLRRLEDALATYDEVVQRFGTSEDPVLREATTIALVNKGALLSDLHRSEDALATYDEVVQRFGTSKVPALREVVATALVNKGALLSDLHRSEDALATYDEVVQRFGAIETPALREATTTALVNKGGALGELHIRASRVPALREVVATALVNKGSTLSELHRPEDALATYDEVVQRFGTSEAPVLRGVVATALVNKGGALGELHRLEDALATYGEIMQRFGTSEAPVLREATTIALVNKGTLLGKLHRPEDALATYDEAVRRLGNRTFPPDPALTEQALLKKARYELECRRYEAAIKTVGQALDLLPELGDLSREILTVLMEFSIELGPARICELIQGSPAAPLLLPLTTALEQELGLNPQVAREVDEVAQDIRKELEEIRNAKGRKG